MSNFFPVDESKIAGGPGRALFAPKSAPVSTKMSDIFGQKSPYTPVSPWVDFGAMTAPPQISRNLAVQGFTIEQSQTAILEEPSDVTRTLSVPIAELSETALAMLEESSGVVTVSAGSGYGSSKKVPFGSIFDLTPYRIALVWRFKKEQGLVTETSTSIVRGASMAWVGHNAKLTAENAQITVGKNTPVSATLTFKLDNESTITAEGSEQGFWIIEDSPQTIA